MSHSPLLNLPGPSQDLLDDIESAIAKARDFVTAYDPELVVIFSPDHYNGFFYRTMPPFCIGTAAQGVGVVTVTGGGPAERAGLRAGDVITRVGAQETPDTTALSQALAAASPGDKVTVTVTRDGEQRDVQITLGELPAS